MEETKWVDIARTGTWKDMNGKVVSIAKQQLDSIVSSFDKTDRRAPLVFGHPKDNQPAYGWVSALRRVGDVLQAKFKQVHEDALQLVENGNFKNVSMSLYPDFTLRHVGLLGAMQPAIPGLNEVSFAEEDGVWYIELASDERESRIAHLEAELAIAQQKLADVKFGSESKRNDRLQKLIAGALVLPSETETIISLAESLGDSERTFQFAEGEDPVPMEEAFWQFLETRQKHGLFEQCRPDRKAETAKKNENPAELI